MAAASGRKGGRPPNPSGTSLSKTMNFRVLPALYNQLAEAAAREGRSLSEEVATRLGRSFQVDEIEKRRFGDEGVAFLANLFAGCLNLVHFQTKKKTWEDAEVRELSKEAICDVIDASADIFKDAENISLMQRKYDREEMRKTWAQLIEIAERASIEPNLSLADIMGR